jgi:hypothetical protein
MELEDIQKNILYNIDDFNSLVNYCHLNKQTQQICSSKSFWINLFNEWGLDLPINIPNSFNGWLNEFYAIYNTNNILYYLTLRTSTHPQVETSIVSTKYTFNHIYYDLNYFITLIQNIGIDLEPSQNFLRHFDIINQPHPTQVNFIIVRLYHVGFSQNLYEITIKVENTLEAFLIKRGYDDIIFPFIKKDQIQLFLYNILLDHAV